MTSVTILPKMSEFARVHVGDLGDLWPILAPMVESALENSCSFAPSSVVMGRIASSEYMLFRATSGDYQSAIAVVDFEKNSPEELWANLVLVYVDPHWPEGREFLMQHLHDALRELGCTHAHFFSVRKGAPWMAEKHGYQERFVEFWREL